MKKYLIIVALIFVLLIILALLPKKSGQDDVSNQEVPAISNLETKFDRYQEFNSDKISLATDNKVVIFFHASWCPSCKSLNSDIVKNVFSIPENVFILKADYDTETEMKQKYGVTTQHTLVQVDAEGNLIKKWSGGSRLSSVLSQIQ